MVLRSGRKREEILTYFARFCAATNSDKLSDAFLRLWKNKGLKEERMAKVGLDAIGKSTPLESNKSQPTLRQSYHAPSGHHEACKWSPQGGNLQGSLCAPLLACVTRLASMHSSKGNIVLLDRRPIALLPSPCGAGTRALQAIFPPPRHEVNPVGQDLVLAPFLAVLPVPTAPFELITM